MSVRVYFGGVGGTQPKGGRGLPCIFVKTENHIISLDFGEGCQEAYFNFRLKVNAPLVILFSHLHGDHILGIKPFLQTLSLLDRRKKITIIGPYLTDQVIFGRQTIDTTFPVEIIEIYKREGTINLEELKIDYVTAPHVPLSYSYIIKLKDKINLDPNKLQADNIPPTLRKQLQKEGYIIYNKKIFFLEKYIKTKTKGIKIAYSGDTLPNYRFAAKSLHADLLIHEATLTHGDFLTTATIPHASALQAAQIAKQAKAKLLALVHISSRYNNDIQLLKEAQKIFPKTILPKKGDVIEILSSLPRLFNFYNFIFVDK